MNEETSCGGPIMTHRGTVRSGFIALPADVAPPEGAEVVIIVPGEGPPRTSGDGVWSKLADLAENHDHYLHGHPKHP
jgi:hypothetical protein